MSLHTDIKTSCISRNCYKMWFREIGIVGDINKCYREPMKSHKYIFKKAKKRRRVIKTGDVLNEW